MTPQEIKALRIKAGFSQTEFAKVLGISISNVRNWEAGRRKIPEIAKQLINHIFNQQQKP